VKLGAHMPISGGLWTALSHGASIGCEVVQLFLKNNRQWRWLPLSQEEIDKFLDIANTHRFFAVFAHSSYLINLAASDPTVYHRSLTGLIDEIRTATLLRIPFIVIHPGSHVGTGKEIGLKKTICSLNHVFAETKNFNVMIALETTAGQGSSLGSTLEELAQIFNGCAWSNRLGLCLDTAHLFAAGYDIRIRKIWDNIVRQIETYFGLNKILAFHLNDSVSDVGSRVDRHADIGHGKIGLKTFKFILNDERFRLFPGCIETPKTNGLQKDIINLKVLRSLVKDPVKRNRP